MTTFPSLTPSSRTYTPGEYPNTSFSGISGVQRRVRHSNVMLSSQLRLGFIALTEAEMLSILSHYQGQLGAFMSFSLPSAVWSGVNNAADYQLNNYQWRYVEPPTVEDLICGGHNVELVLETVPPEGVTAAGLARSVLITMAAGLAARANGLNISVVSALNAGLAGPLGLSEGVSVALDPGVAVGSVDHGGLDHLVTCSISGGAAVVDAVEQDGLDGLVTWNISGGSATGTVQDPYFSSVDCLLHFDGANNATTTSDSSSNSRTITIGVSGALTTSTAKYGTASVRVPSNVSRVTYTGAALGSGDFTVEFWVAMKDTGGSCVIFDNRSSSSGSDGFKFVWSVYGYPQIISGNLVRIQGSTLGATANTFYHVAAVRASGVFRLYVNGSDVNPSSPWNTTANFTNTSYAIGGNSYESHSYEHWIDDYRVTIGVARYTSNFTPPDAAFPNS